MVEHSPDKGKVAGSSPAGPTKVRGIVGRPVLGLGNLN